MSHSVYLLRSPLHGAIRGAALARAAVIALTALVLAGSSVAAWSQAMQQQPVAQAPQKSMIIQVAPAQTQLAPAAPTVIQQQAVQPPSVQQPAVQLPETPAPVAAAPAAENPGFINELGKLFKNSTSMLPSLPAMPSLDSWSKGADGLTRMNTIVKGRVVCPVAANGAPDCKAASDRLCQSKGFKDGKSLDTDAAQSCSAKAMIPGRKQEEGDCRTENYVTQALCQ